MLVRQWGNERDLQIDLLTTLLGSGGYHRNLGERTGKLLYGFYQRRALQRPLSRLAQ
jgi:hypothetical protein